MSEEVQNLAEVVSAPAPEVTATPEVASNVPEVVENQPDQPAAKSFTQEELDAAIGKRLAREQRKWERERQAETQAKQYVPTDIPSVEHFESPEAYAQVLALKKAEELVAQRDYHRQQAEIKDAYVEREEEARVKYDDFEQVAYNPNVRITDVMAEAIQASDIGPDVAYHLGSNPKEADRISRLSPILQAREIGRIEARMANNPAVKQTTSAPAPIVPVTARASNTATYDTTDPRSDKMSASQWIEAERARQTKKWEAQRNR